MPFTARISHKQQPQNYDLTPLNISVSMQITRKHSPISYLWTYWQLQLALTSQEK